MSLTSRATRPQFDRKEGVIGDKTIPRQYFRREEIGRNQGFPVRFEERPPICGFAANRSGLESMPAANVVDRGIADSVAEVIQCADDPFAAPRTVFLHQFDDELLQLRVHARASD